MIEQTFTISEVSLEAFAEALWAEERARSTICTYVRNVRAFARWLGSVPLTKETVQRWKSELLQAGYQPSTINLKLTSLDRYLRFLGREDCMVRQLRLQRQLFRDSSRDLSKEEYKALVRTARSLHDSRTELLLETLAATGIRVSELKNITVKAAENKRARIALKGKIRVILLPEKLCRKLLAHAKERGIQEGPILCTKKGHPLSRGMVWKNLKRVAVRAGIDERKVYPHNLRHLFARTFYEKNQDIVQLSDVLGHSALETTRRYLITTEGEHRRTIDALGLVL